MGRGWGCERRQEWRGRVTDVVGLGLGMGREMELGAKAGNGLIGKTKIIRGPLIDASEMHSLGGHLVIPLLLGMLPAQPHPSQINGCLSTQETTSCGHTL